MKDGGPAFPCSTWTEKNGVQIGTPASGMSLRDYFAAKALLGLWSNANFTTAALSKCDTHEKMDAVMSVRAYSMADAMLAVRDSETLPEARTNCPRCGLGNEGKDDPVNCSQCGCVWHRVAQGGYGG
jgi:hypothetical protein